jgi:hypothetical protein
MLILSGHQKRVLEAIRSKGYHPNMWKELKFSTHAQFSQIIKQLVFGGFLKEQPKYKATRKH